MRTDASGAEDSWSILDRLRCYGAKLPWSQEVSRETSRVADSSESSTESRRDDFGDVFAASRRRRRAPNRIKRYNITRVRKRGLGPSRLEVYFFIFLFAAMVYWRYFSARSGMALLKRKRMPRSFVSFSALAASREWR